MITILQFYNLKTAIEIHIDIFLLHYSTGADLYFYIIDWRS